MPVCLHKKSGCTMGGAHQSVLAGEEPRAPQRCLARVLSAYGWLRGTECLQVLDVLVLPLRDGLKTLLHGTSIPVSVRDCSLWDLRPSPYRRLSYEAQPSRSHSCLLFRSCRGSMSVRVFQGPMRVRVLPVLREPSIRLCVL